VSGDISISALAKLVREIKPVRIVVMVDFIIGDKEKIRICINSDDQAYFSL